MDRKRRRWVVKSIQNRFEEVYIAAKKECFGKALTEVPIEALKTAVYKARISEKFIGDVFTREGVLEHNSTCDALIQSFERDSSLAFVRFCIDNVQKNFKNTMRR